MALATLAVAACGTGTPDAAPTGTPSEAVASPVPSDSALPSASPTVSPSTSASPSETETEAVPTDTERARFVADYRPEGAAGLDHVQVDLDGDGVEEVVVVYVRTGENVAHVDVAAWDPETAAYGVVAGADGGVADRIDRVRVDDLNGDGATEIALFTSRGSSGGSVTLWRAEAARLAPLRARGGCHDGSNVFGVIGAEVDDRDGDGIAEVYATCDDSPVPVSAWTTDGYRWQGDGYVYDPAI